MWVTAEGIEDPEALEHLRDRGCGQGQCFLFSPARAGGRARAGVDLASLR